MPSLSLNGCLIWFAHCPKAGGTSVEQFMVTRWGDAVGHLHWGWDFWWQKGGWRVANPPNSPQHLIWEDAVAQLPRAPDAIFAVVRDPVARLASEHRWQRSGRRGTRLGKALAYLPFSLWLQCMLEVARLNPYAFDNHVRPQGDFVPEGAEVFRLEDGLELVVQWLIETTGTCPEGGLTPHAIPTGTPQSIDPRSAALIARAFVGDYARFGYVQPDIAPALSGPVSWLIRRVAPLIVLLDRRGSL